MEDRLPVHLGRSRLLLVLRRAARGARRLDEFGVDRVRLFQRHRRIDHYGRGRVFDLVFARPLHVALREPLRPVKGSKIELVTIGDELLLGFTVNSNAAYISRELGKIGLEMVRHTTVSDKASEIRAAVHEALTRTGAVITTGGLGPTSDDLTKPAIAELFGRRMVFDQAVFDGIAKRWASLFPSRPFPSTNRGQAEIPEGATILVNRHGSAPGILLEDADGRFVAMLPGVPREMRGMLGEELLKILKRGAA